MLNYNVLGSDELINISGLKNYNENINGQNIKILIVEKTEINYETRNIYFSKSTYCAEFFDLSDVPKIKWATGNSSRYISAKICFRKHIDGNYYLYNRKDFDDDCYDFWYTDFIRMMATDNFEEIFLNKIL